MSRSLLLAGMPGNPGLLTARRRFIRAIWRQPAAGDSPVDDSAVPPKRAVPRLKACRATPQGRGRFASQATKFFASKPVYHTCIAGRKGPLRMGHAVRPDAA